MDHLIVALKPVIAARADWWDNPHDDWQKRSLTRALPLAAMEYGVDAWQRSVLFLDAMRKRREQFVEHATEETLNVLDHDAKLVLRETAPGVTPDQIRAATAAKPIIRKDL